VLPPAELPRGALLLFEQMAEDEDERSANSRWYVRDDGAFLHARNRPGGEPEHWTVPFPDEPARRFDEAQLAALRDAITAADLPRLARRPAGRPEPEPSHVIVERWSVLGPQGPVTVEVCDDEPPEIAALRAVVNRLVAESR
jgi:hypothetical protein